jgi:hypothetical protein
MPGYSPKPLVKKLGIKPGSKILLLNAPEEYFDWLETLPEDVRVLENANSAQPDFIHLFAKSKKELIIGLDLAREIIAKKGMIWVSWYKKAAKIPTDVTEDTIREVALPNGLVDIKVCAVTEQWSGLKLVWRK